MPELLRLINQSEIEVGAKVPNFTLLDMNNNKFTLNDIIGKPAVLYFYPLDNSSGCTIEACEFRDVYDELQELDCDVYGISPDDHEDHVDFSNENNLPFQLCCDPSQQMMKDYGIWGEYELFPNDLEYLKKFPKVIDRIYDDNKLLGVVRSTFLIDKNALLIRKWVNVKAQGHASSVKDQLNKSFNFEIGF
ncbi:MAG: peroxiredoxin [Chloroflexi bacterium]|nr:peroxiredoxin [Chloroflexota bacterium]|tara:strand:- start:400 stop:972 length:573 start_codon:yes stop_codon:yes gene_type:complete